MNLNTNLSHSNKNAYPTKNTINLMMTDKEPMKLYVLIPALVVLAVVIGLFCKFAVIDRLSAAFTAENEARNLEQQLSDVQEALRNYDDVEAKYSRYFSDALTAGKAPRSYDEVLALIERRLMPNATISAVSYTGSLVSMQISVPRLDDAAGIIDELSREPAVENVSITTADNNDAKGDAANVIMTIILKGDGAE